MIPNTTRLKSSRKCTYLIKSRHGVFSFRWNILINGKHHQPRISLKTRDYQTALKLAIELAQRIQKLYLPSVEQIKEIYSSFLEAQTQAIQKLSEIDITKFVGDLAPKSIIEYRNCWKAFIKSCQNSELLVAGITESHVEKWKKEQTCAPATLKKKLRLLGSCFTKVGIKHNIEWFRFTVKKTPESVENQRRAFTDKEVRSIFRETKQYKHDVDNWKYYLPRLALLTGCRINELSQLRVSDILVDDNPRISINSNGNNKRLKNLASVRNIPLTKYAIDLISPLVKNKAKDLQLFPTLNYTDVGGYARRASKYFTQLCKHQLKLKNATFHSFRHYAVTYLFNKGVGEHLIGSLVGHSVGTLTTSKVYMSGFNDDIRREAISYLIEPCRVLDE